jgi:hypothetical protein
MRPSAENLTEVRETQGEIMTAAAGETMRVVAQGRDPVLPGQVLVVEGLDVPLVSFHAMEAGGYEYVRHPRVPRLREWHRDGKAISELTFCVYPNNLAVWHRDGAAHRYPKKFPESMGAYRAVEGVPSSAPANVGTTTHDTNSYATLGVDEGTDEPRKIVHFAEESIRATPRTLRQPTERRRQQGPRVESMQALTSTPTTPTTPTQRVSMPQPKMEQVKAERLNVASTNRYAGLHVEDGEDEEEEGKTDMGMAARRASKLWTTVHAGDGRFHVMLMHAAAHMGEQRMIEMVENNLLLNTPGGLTTKAIRAHFPTQCLPCRMGKAKKTNRDRRRLGNATGREEVPLHQLHRDGCCDRMTDLLADQEEREIGDVVAIDDIDWAGGAEENRWGTNRYILASVDLATGKFAGGEVHGGKDAESCLVALDKIITRYRNAGHPIKKFRCDHQFGDIIAEGLEARGIGVEHSCPYEHQTNGDIERFNQTLENHLRAMMAGRNKDCPYWWPEALKYFILMWNATSVVKHGVSAHSNFYGARLDYAATPLLPWGCAVESLALPKPTNNAEPRTRSGFFVGCAQKHFRCVRIVPKGGTKDADIVTRRSYWAEASQILAAEEGDETRAAIEAEVWTLSEARKWLGDTPGLDYRLTREDEEKMGMEMEDRRSHGVRGEKESAQWAMILDEARARRSAELKRRQDELATTTEQHNQKKEAKQTKQREAARERDEKKTIQTTKKNHRLMLQEMRHAHKATRQEREQAERRTVQEGRRTSTRTHVNNEKADYAYSSFVHAPTIHGKATRAHRLVDTETNSRQEFANLVTGMLTAERSLYEIAKTDKERETFNTVLPAWWKGWRASTARVDMASIDGSKSNMEQPTLLETRTITYMPDPKGWKQMERHPHAKEFMAAAEAEIEKLESMGAGEEVPGGRKGVPPGAQILRSIFTFVTKRMADTGQVEKFKARCVADGSKQNDADDTHAPTIGATTLRTLLAVSVAAGHARSTADVESAFLIEKIDKDTYVQLPVDYTNNKGVAPRVWKLLKSLYGLKQAPRLFWLGMRDTLIGAGFRSSDHDPCLFIRKEEDGSHAYVGTHVDDLMISSTLLATNQRIRDQLLKKYKGITWHDKAKTFVGLALEEREDGSLLVSQPAYTDHILEALHIQADGKTSNPNFQKTARANTADVVREDLIQWLRLAVGLVQYVTFTRMEVHLALNQVARCMHKPTAQTEEAMLQILNYIGNRPRDGLLYTRSGQIKLTCWVDASWQSEKGNVSRTGYAINIGANSAAVMAYSKAQIYATLSSQHSEIVALTEAVRSVLHLRMLLEDMGYKQEEPTEIHEDNAACIAFANSTAPLEKTKHIANRDRFVREAVNAKQVKIVKIHTKMQPVDGLTKVIGGDEFKKMRLFLQRGREMETKTK